MKSFSKAWALLPKKLFHALSAFAFLILRSTVCFAVRMVTNTRDGAAHSELTQSEL